MRTETAVLLVIRCYCRRKKERTKPRKNAKLLYYLLIRLLTKYFTYMALTDESPVQKWEKWGYRLFILATVIWQAIQQLIEKW